MLILSRRIDEDLIIELNGEIVRVTVLGIKGGQVRIGCKASRRVQIHREEIWKRIKNEARESSERDNQNIDFSTNAEDYNEPEGNK